MAKVEISKWEIAKMFGLEYLGEANNLDSYGDEKCVYHYGFHGRDIDIENWQYDCEEDAHEEAAKVVLTAIGKAAAGHHHLFEKN